MIKPAHVLQKAMLPLLSSASALHRCMCMHEHEEAPWCVQVFFEVGIYTNRVHLHAKRGGSQLLGLSLPLDLLSAPVSDGGPSTIQELLRHLNSRCSAFTLKGSTQMTKYNVCKC